MLTLKKVNAELRANGITAELLKGKDVYYLDGAQVQNAYSDVIAVYRLNHLTLEEWVARAKRIVEDSNKRS